MAKQYHIAHECLSKLPIEKQLLEGNCQCPYDTDTVPTKRLCPTIFSHWSWFCLMGKYLGRCMPEAVRRCARHDF